MPGSGATWPSGPNVVSSEPKAKRCRASSDSTCGMCVPACAFPVLLPLPRQETPGMLEAFRHAPMRYTLSLMMVPGVLIALPILVLIAATVLLIAGLRGRRVDDHPLCRRCGFDLVGSPRESVVC